VVCAVTERRLSSQTGLKGIVKKVFMFLLVGLSHVTDMYLIGGGSAIRTAVIIFFVANEGISLLENAARAGLSIPPALKSSLLAFKRPKNEFKNDR